MLLLFFCNVGLQAPRQCARLVAQHHVPPPPLPPPPLLPRRSDYNKRSFVRSELYASAAAALTGANRRVMIDYLERVCTTGGCCPDALPVDAQPLPTSPIPSLLVVVVRVHGATSCPRFILPLVLAPADRHANSPCKPGCI